MVNTTHPKHQHYYDFLVQETGCAGKNDTLACLRNAPYDTLLSAINETPAAFSTSGLNFTYGASVDGNFFDRTLKESVRDGIYAQVRTIISIIITVIAKFISRYLLSTAPLMMREPCFPFQ